MNNQIIFLLGSFTLYNRMEQCLQKVQPGASFTFGKQHQPSTCQDKCLRRQSSCRNAHSRDQVTAQDGHEHSASRDPEHRRPVQSALFHVSV